MESAKVQRREERIGKRRSAILTVAKKAFLARPYSEVTVEVIAAEAGLGKTTVYLYFKNKAEIYEGVLERDIGVLVDSLRAGYDETKGLEENLLALAERYIAHFMEYSEYFISLSFFYYPGRSTKLPPAIAERIEEIFASATKVVEDCIRHAIERGEIASRDTGQTTAALWSMWLGATYLALTDPNWKYARSLDEVIKTGVRIFARSLLSGERLSGN